MNVCVCVISCIWWYRDDRLALYTSTTVTTESRESCRSIWHVPVTAKRQQACYVFIVNSTYVIDSTAVFRKEPLSIQNIPEANWFLHRSFFTHFLTESSLQFVLFLFFLTKLLLAAHLRKERCGACFWKWFNMHTYMLFYPYPILQPWSWMQQECTLSKSNRLSS
jgi:hypothetical protein